MAFNLQTRINDEQEHKDSNFNSFTTVFIPGFWAGWVYFYSDYYNADDGMMSLLREAMTALLSGLTTKTGEEIHWKDQRGKDITIEPINTEQDLYIARGFHKNGNIWFKNRIKGDKFHGKCLGWYDTGTKKYEINFKNGMLHGRYIYWYIDGTIMVELEYDNNVCTKIVHQSR